MTEQIEKNEQIQIQDIFSMNNGTNECSFFGVTLNNDFDNIFQDILSTKIGSSNQTVNDSVQFNPSHFPNFEVPNLEVPKDRSLISFQFYETYEIKIKL